MNFREKFKKIEIDKALLWAFIGLGAVALVLRLSTGSESKDASVAGTDPVDVDTVIPAGYVLIPVELSNAESLSSMTGPFALVDLYSGGSRKGVKVASAAKLLRAPLNPQQFAVLLREADGGRVLKAEGPFFAALRNRKDVDLKVPGKTSPALTITYGD